MQHVANILRDFPNQTKLFSFIADAPTTTLQRIKALTTGTIPAFIEVGDNFAASNVVEDNIIDQFIQTKKNVTFLGDDTWYIFYFFLKNSLGFNFYPNDLINRFHCLVLI